MATPRGTFELKYFFGSHVATEAGGAASSTAIGAWIKQLVAAEDAKAPLSDARISRIHGEQGIVVARRTIAKYREALQIPPVTQTKALSRRSAYNPRAPMSLVANLLRADHIVLDLQVSSKKRLFEQAGLLFENHHGLARSLVFDSLFARERPGSTGLGQGVAIPHGRIKGLKEALGAFLRLDEPVPFDAPDGNPVSLVFVLLVPEKATEKHLQILSELAQMFSDKALREAMSGAPDAGALHQLITAG